MYKLTIVLTVYFFSIFSKQTNGQNWEKRHEFAKSYFGINNVLSSSLSNGGFINSQGEIESFIRNPFISQAINVGATHFWGYADFFVSINTTNIRFRNDKIENKFNFGTFTGLRVYPKPLYDYSVRPYLGYQFSPWRYEQENEDGSNFKVTKVKSTIELGLGYKTKNIYSTIGFNKSFNPNFETWITDANKISDTYPKYFFNLGINYSIETTKSASTENSKKSNNHFKNSNSKGFFSALGPSSSFPIKHSSYILNKYPYLDDKSFPNIFPDFSIGYHSFKNDFIIAVSARPMSQSREAFKTSINIKRRSINLEGYKFLFDYHGFVPYLGLGIAREKIKLTEIHDTSEYHEETNTSYSPNIVFGWDIRPSEFGDWWILRTNLRYFPQLKINKGANYLSLQHLEFNFIQLVIYPQKLFWIQNQ